MHFGSKSSRTALFFVIGCWVFGLASAEQPRVAFVTSVTGNGNLSSWPDAGGASGLAAGDAICRARAAAAKLANAENFVAWLSDSSNDAFCRVHGLSGKRSNNCGLAELPPPAGPWVRTDGFPFAQTIDRALSFGDEIISPMRFDEFGNERLGANVLYMTGTDRFGEGSERDCTGWTSSAASGVTKSVGSSARTHEFWTELGFQFTCANSLPIVCMESGTGPDLQDFSSTGNLVFVTNSSGPGDLSAWQAANAGLTGIAAGDSICRNEATEWGLPFPESFKAWLSDDSVNAIDRLEYDGPWVRLDGALIVSNKTELSSGQFFVPINILSRGVYSSGAIYTGTGSAGLAEGPNCRQWSSGESTELGTVGFPFSSILSEWTSGASFGNPAACSVARRLYCFSDLLAEDTETIFADRFEVPGN